MTLYELMEVISPTTRIKIMKPDSNSPKQDKMLADDVKMNAIRSLYKQNIDPYRETIDEILTDMNVNSVMGVIKYTMVVKLR